VSETECTLKLEQSATILNHFTGLNVSLPALKNSHYDCMDAEGRAMQEQLLRTTK